MAANPILICAPSDELRTELETQLGSAGYATTSVTTPAAAVGALRDGSFDLVVAEGLAVSGAIGRIRTAAAEPTPVLVVAPADDVEARIAFLEAGADDVVSTGFARHELEAKVEEDRRLTNELTGDPERKTKGLRQLLTEERSKQEGLIAETGIEESLRINREVESELILKRLASIRERIRELEAFLKLRGGDGKKVEKDGDKKIEDKGDKKKPEGKGSEKKIEKDGADGR